MPERLSVLLIEDDIHDVELVQRAFSTVHPPIFDLYHAPRFLDAIQQIKQITFHVVLLDLGLPDSVGLNGVERLMSQIPAIPVIVLTGSGDDESALAGIALGAQEFLDKNEVTPKRMIRTIRHAIKRKQHSLEQSGIGADTADQERLKKLAGIMRQTTADVSSSVGNLMRTDLTEEQRSLVSHIEETSQKSVDAANRLSPESVVFVEATEI